MSKVIFYFRTFLYSVTLLAVSFFAVGIGLVCTLLGKRLNTNYYVARTFWHLCGVIMGWNFEVEGEEHLWVNKGSENGLGEGQGEAGKQGRSAVMVGNHQSFVDILYLGRIFPKHAAIMAKKSLSRIPGLGWFMLLSGTVFIDRSNNKSAVAMMQTAGEDMKRKRISLWIFPEGTRHLSPKTDLLSFKKGAFYLAVQSGVPVVPVVCENYHHLFDGKTRFKSGVLKIKVLPPIPTTGLTTADVPALMEKTRNLMLSALQSISAKSDADSSTTPLLSRASQEYSSIETPADAKQGDQSADEARGGSANSGGAAGSGNSKGVKEAKKIGKKSKLAIAMVSDFFHPVAGGVEAHVYFLSVELMRRGHKVIVITHHHPPRVGIRYLAPGLKVYHLPYTPISAQATLPNFFLSMPYLRSILLREAIGVVHGHGSLSSLAHEALLQASLLGRDIRTIFTDHSLFGFGDAVGILTNKLLAGALRNVDGVICVSNTGRENTVLRAELDPALVSVIANALVSSQFQPDPSRCDPSCITVVVISRLVYRKGIDLLVACAPRICEMFPQVRFVIGGDGPKMVDLEQMREKHLLQDKVELVGAVRPSGVRELLTRGQIYLNTSLTEAFGISIIEAASCGLLVVATKVGGVPEILPEDMITFSRRADEEDVISALSDAIRAIEISRPDPWALHERVKGMYDWRAVAERVEAVYLRAMDTPQRDLGERIARLITLGPIFGPILCIITAIQHCFYWCIEWLMPIDEMDIAEDSWDHGQFREAVRRERASDKA